VELGYKTIRFHDDELMHDLENVERVILHELIKEKRLA
jgi:very-short-patch-repair endonuclease